MLAGAGHVAVTITEEREQHETAVSITNVKKIPHMKSFQIGLFTADEFDTSSF